MITHTEATALTEFSKWLHRESDLPVIREYSNMNTLGTDHLFVTVMSRTEEDYGWHNDVNVLQPTVLVVRVEAHGADAIEKLNRAKSFWFTVARLSGVQQQGIDDSLSTPAIRGSGWSPVASCAFTMGYTALYTSKETAPVLADKVNIKAEVPEEGIVAEVSTNTNTTSD